MELKDLKRIVDIMNRNGLCEIEIEQAGTRIRVRKPDGSVRTVVAAPAAAASSLPAEEPAAPAPAPPAAAPAAPAESLHTITAPMVGTFYRSPSPEAESYVDVGHRVTPDTVVCILEAMKVMNEIKAECTGEVVKILVQDAEAVEYGQALFQVKVA
jgi:acetyl-CoA carboxylase biotin carboxyl carrier protein